MYRCPTFQLYDYKDTKCNFHTHTTRCRHAIGTEREYIEKAIEAGYQVLGFSDHSPYLFEEGHVSHNRMEIEELEGYIKAVENLKQEYKKEIQIFTGLELEYLPKFFEKTFREIRKYPLDYLILGQHYFDEECPEDGTGHEWKDEERLKTYIDRVIEAIDTGYFLYVAHPDMINYAGDEAIYNKYMKRLTIELKKHNMPIEINVNGCRERRIYPNKRFIELGIENGNDFIIGVDAHTPQDLTDGNTYQECLDLAPGAIMWTGERQIK